MWSESPGSPPGRVPVVTTTRRNSGGRPSARSHPLPCRSAASPRPSCRRCIRSRSGRRDRCIRRRAARPPVPPTARRPRARSCRIHGARVLGDVRHVVRQGLALRCAGDGDAAPRLFPFGGDARSRRIGRGTHGRRRRDCVVERPRNLSHASFNWPSRCQPGHTLRWRPSTARISPACCVALRASRERKTRAPS